MNKNKFLFVGLLSVALVFGMMLTSCDGDGQTWGGGETGNITSLKIVDRDVDLGTPNSDPSKAAAGSVTLYTLERNEAGVPVMTINKMSVVTTPTTAKTEWAVGTGTPPDAGAYKSTRPGSLKNGDYLWIKISVDQAKYYVIKTTVKYGSSNFDPIKTHPASRSFTMTEWESASAASKALKVEMAEESPDYAYQWYKNTVFSNKGGTAIEGETNSVYTPIITATGDSFYYVTITLSQEIYTSNAAMIRITGTTAAPETAFQIGDTRLNYVRGIGGTGSFMFRAGTGDASPDADVKYIDLLMGELGLNVLRIMVQDDYENYITNAVQSPNNQTQFYHNARDNFFPVIRKVNEYGGYVFANPWTAPVSMKNTGSSAPPSLTGGRLTENGPNYVDYAEHLRGFLKWLNQNNAPIFALGILNEPDFGGGANYEGMGMSASVTRDWFKTVGNFTTQKVTNRQGAGITSSIFEDDIIPGYGGGKATHHVLAMSGDSMGDIIAYMNSQLDDPVANNNIELMGRHYYASAARYTKVAGNPPHNASPTAWKDRPQLNYGGPFEDDALAMSPQMYAPGSQAGNIKREIWQTEHDFNNHGISTRPPASNVQEFWNSAFAALHDIDWGLRVMGESVFCWWYTSSWSGFVTSYQTAGFPPYTITPRGRAAAHYARYVNETWFLPISRTRGTVNFNATATSFNAGSTDPKISAYEDVNGKFITVVMYTPTYSTQSAVGGTISNDYGQGGTYGSNDPTAGSTYVGRIEINLPDGFIASGASAIRTYGNGNATSDDAAWTDANPVAAGSPRYWIDEPVFVSSDGKSVEVTLPKGNIISIMIRGEWTGAQATSRHFEDRVRPYTVK